MERRRFFGAATGAAASLPLIGADVVKQARIGSLNLEFLPGCTFEKANAYTKKVANQTGLTIYAPGDKDVEFIGKRDPVTGSPLCVFVSILYDPAAEWAQNRNGSVIPLLPVHQVTMYQLDEAIR